MSQIIIQNLDFTYEGDHTPVFQNLSLQLDTGWKLGLVGRNGRGKTTLLRLLEGRLEGRGTLLCPERPLYFPRPASRPERTATSPGPVRRRSTSAPWSRSSLACPHPHR